MIRTEAAVACGGPAQDDYGFYLPGIGVGRRALPREKKMDMKRKEAVPGIPRRTARPAAPRKSASSAGGEHESQRQQMIA